MRLSRLLLTTAALALAPLPAVGQQADPPAAQDEADPPRGLSDLEATVNELLEEEVGPDSERDAPAPEEAAEPDAESQAEPATPPEPEPVEPAPGTVEPVDIPPAERPESLVPAEEEEAPTSAATDEPAATEEAPADEPEAAAEPEEPEAGDPEAAEPDESPPPTAPEAAPPLTGAEIAALERTVERGRLLVAIARAGILATQDMLTRVSDPEGAGISGWIAEPAGSGMEVTFYAAGEDGPRAVYGATVNGGRVVSREIHLGEDRPPLGPVQARMAAARAATEALDHGACTDQPFNVLVVPPASAGAPIDVYQTSAPARRGVFPLGGHFRSTVDADGNVVETRSFANSCVELQAPAQAAGGPARPIGVTHFLDSTPTEIHMFIAQLAGRPLLVATGEPQRIWLVTGDRIAEVRQ